MRHRAIGNFVSSVVIAVLGFAFAFLLFVASLKIYQYAYDMHEAASLMNTDVTEFRQLQLLTVIVDLCAGIPFVITVFTASMINKQKGISSMGRRAITLMSSVMFILMMLFLFEPVANMGFMYPLIPKGEMGYGFLILYVQIFACGPVALIALISLIVLIVSAIRNR